MARASIAYIAPQYENYKNWYLKAFEPLTVTTKLMHDEATGGNSFTKLQINSEGFIISSGGTKIIPYISGDYDLYIFPTADEADENDTSNAIRLARFKNAESDASASSAEDDGFGTVQLLTTTEVQDYTEERFNSDPITPIIDAKVSNVETTYDMIERYNLLAGGGSGFEIGDTILRDKVVGDADDDFILQDGSSFNSSTYPLLAAKDGYNVGKTLTSIDSESDSVFITNTSTTPSNGRLVKVSSNLYYAFAALSGTGQVYKSTDQGSTWSSVSVTYPLGYTNTDRNGAVYDGDDSVLVYNGGKVAIFEVSSETFVTSSTTLPLVLTPLILHYNSNISKWVVFANENNPYTVLIYTSSDGVTWTEEDRALMVDFFEDDSTEGIGRENMSYAHNKYWFCADGVGHIYGIPEDDLRISNDHIVFTTKQPSAPYIATWNLVERPAISATESGQLAYLSRRTTATDNKILFQIFYSEDGYSWTEKIVSVTSANFTVANRYILAPLCHDGFMLIDGHQGSSSKGNFAISNNNLDSFDYEFVMPTYTVNVFNGANASIIVDIESGVIIVNMPTFTTSNAESRNIKLEVTFNASDTYKTKDMSHISSGSLKPYVKAK